MMHGRAGAIRSVYGLAPYYVESLKLPLVANYHIET